jgi:signal transduction histidine kinase
VGEGLGLSILRQACERLGWGCTIVATDTGTRLTLRLA